MFASLLAATITASGLAETAAALELSLFVDRPPTSWESSKNSTGAKHEPGYGCLIGAFLDLDNENDKTYRDEQGKVRRLPEPFEQMAKRRHASYFFYLGYGHKLPLDWVVALSRRGKIVHVALEPNNGLEYVRDDEYLNNLAENLAAVGGPVFLRFASEMNGPWVKYHGDPKEYTEKFQLVAKIMHKKAPNVAMVWCPYTTPTRPIKSYYPGDEAVDWVGVNFYSVTYHNQRKSEPAFQIPPTDKLDWIYDRYSKKKPIMIGEYGAAHFSALEGKSVSDFASGSIRALYRALPRRYPRVKAINYFNGNNLPLSHRKNNNYAVTQDKVALAAYRDAIDHPYFLESLPEIMSPAAVRAKLVPMPLVSGQTLSGTVSVSAWAKVHRGPYSIAILLDGKKVGTSNGLADWTIKVPTEDFPNGRTNMTLKLLKNSKVVATRSMPVKIQN
jgi:hypothetical protein